MRKGFLLRDDRNAFIQYDEDGGNGIEPYDLHNDPKQYTNLAVQPEHADVVGRYKKLMADKLAEVRDNDLGKR